MESVLFKQMKMDPEVQLDDRKLNQVFVFCFVWAFGGSLMESVHSEFDTFTRNLFSTLEPLPGKTQTKNSSHHHANVIEEGSVFDFFISVEQNDFQNWNSMVPAFQYSDQLPFSKILVPTTDTVKFSTLMRICLDVNQSVLFTGMFLHLGRIIRIEDFVNRSKWSW